MRDDNWSTWSATPIRQDTMIWCGGWDADCQWYTYNPSTKTYTLCNHPITNSDDFLKVPAKTSITEGYKADTVYYCLRSRSKKTLPDIAGNDSTVDGAYWFNICRYEIIYHRTRVYGPKQEVRGKALITNDEIEQNYEVLERLNFDYNQPGPTYTVYPHPLPWADASYGYTYPETPDLPHNRFHDESDFPNIGEYGIVNRIPYTSWWNTMEQHGGASNGYMIYCDGMSSAGQVAALTLETNLCAGQKLFFSGYVGNPSNQTGKADPSFVFSVQGSLDGSTWEDITTYLTGDIKPSTNWYQIYFPIVYNEEAKDYHHFRVRIYNMASTFDGNDFIIDDMCIFATKPPLIAYQASTACVESGQNDSLTHVMLRIDYQGITGTGYNDKNVYYTVQQTPAPGDTSFVALEDGYFNEVKRPGTPDTIYGTIYIPKKDHEPETEDSIFRNITDLLLRFDTTLAKKEPEKLFRQGYIYEILDGEVRPVLYVVHQAKMSPDIKYTVRMSGEYKDLRSSICAMTSNLKVTNRMVLELNGIEQTEKEIVDMCANSTYDLSLRVKGSLYLDSVAPIDLNGSCYNDWLLYGDTADATSVDRYGYKYSDIVKVIKDILRCEPSGTTNANQFARNLSEVSRNEMARIQTAENVSLSDPALDPYTILSDLVRNGFLTLYKSQITEVVLYGDSVQYVIFPIVGTGTDAMHNANVEVCPSPILIKLKPNADIKAPLMVGGLNRDATERSKPVGVVASVASANDQIALRVDSIREEVGIYSVVLRSTDDPNFLEGIHTLKMTPDKDYPNASYYHKGDTIFLTPALDNNYSMKAGYHYTFNIIMQTYGGSLRVDGEASCEVGTVPFVLSVVPDYLRWEPKNAANSQWNDPDNWIGIDQHNVPIQDDGHFAPLPSTRVIIPTPEEGDPYPVLPNLNNKASYDSVKMVGFTYNTCDAIRLMPGAALGQQQRMTIPTAIIDMSLPNGKWALRSAPVKGMLSGDLFMAQADINEATSPWEVGAFDASGRNNTTGNASYWLSLYSSQSVHYGNTEKNDTVAAAAEWARVTNGMTLSLPPGTGWAVYTRTASGRDAAVRLPKDDDIYYYYTRSGNISYDHYEHNLRSKRDEFAGGTGKAGELAFQPTGASQAYTLTNSVASTSFVFGNPTLAYIDIWGFISDNSSLSATIGYINASGNYTTVPRETAEAVGSKDTITNIQRYLPPMHAIVLTKTGDPGTELSLTLDTNRVVTSASQKVRAAAPLRGSADAKRRGIMTITAINPVSSICTSRLLLGQGYHRAIRDGEDAVLTTINVDQFNSSTPATPFNIYASEGNYGLCIDLRDEIVNVPISFYMSNLPYDPVTHLWFTGVNNIDGPLVLYDALTNTERDIIDGICLDIETPSQSHIDRYYVRLSGYTPDNPDTNPIATEVELFEMDGETAVKVFRDGNVYIIRNGHIYTMLGQKVERVGR